MQKSEFENLLGKPVTDQEFELIETVYNYHPLLCEHQDAVNFWRIGGARIYNDMLPTAMLVRNARIDLEKARRNIEKAEAEEATCIYFLQSIKNPEPIEV